jgi:uncharacterized membrane protein
LGVPALVIGQTVLVGVNEIPSQLPAIIEQGLKAGGIDWPVITDLDAYLYPSASNTTLATATIENATVSTRQSATTGYPAIDKFMRDPVGNSLAVAVLLAMIVSLIWVLVRFVNGESIRSKSWPKWVIPVLSVVGLGIALYMTFVETTRTQAFCGPIGDCNTVQQSRYAWVFGFLPVGLLGTIGYVVILITWLVHQFGSQRLKRLAGLTLWGLVLFGTLFSTYLTFLEPFVIGATCIWCISQAIVMTISLWASTALAQPLLQPDYGVEDNGED